MNPRITPTRSAVFAEAVARRRMAEEYLAVASALAEADGAAVNVCVGNCVLAGIAASDAICIVAVGEYSVGPDHRTARHLLDRVDPKLGSALAGLLQHKSASHYGVTLIADRHRTQALRAASVLVDEARLRTL